jgi:hypothetical protein
MHSKSSIGSRGADADVALRVNHHNRWSGRHKYWLVPKWRKLPALGKLREYSCRRMEL